MDQKLCAQRRKICFCWLPHSIQLQWLWEYSGISILRDHWGKGSTPAFGFQRLSCDSLNSFWISWKPTTAKQYQSLFRGDVVCRCIHLRSCFFLSISQELFICHCQMAKWPVKSCVKIDLENVFEKQDVQRQFSDKLNQASLFLWHIQLTLNMKSYYLCYKCKWPIHVTCWCLLFLF